VFGFIVQFWMIITFGFFYALQYNHARFFNFVKI